MIKHFDVAIIGGGPAGLTTAIMLKNSGLRIALFEKGQYPKQAVCGDGLTEDVMRQLPKISSTLYQTFKAHANQQQIQHLTIQYMQRPENKFDLRKIGDGYRLHTFPRHEFDHILYQEAKGQGNIEFYLNEKIKRLAFLENEVKIEAATSNFSACMVLGADGNNSVVLSSLPKLKEQLKASVIQYPAVQAYFSAVDGIRNDEIKLCFIEESKPFYFWIFPLADGRFNVGMGALNSTLKKKGLDLKSAFGKAMKSNPSIAPHFKRAEQITKTKGRPITSSIKEHALSGNRVLLLGDAAGCTDYFTGEGVANALRCGRFAAETVRSAFGANRFDEFFLKQYDRVYYKATKYEVLKSKTAAAIFEKPWLAKFLLRLLQKKHA